MDSVHNFSNYMLDAEQEKDEEKEIGPLFFHDGKWIYEKKDEKLD